MGRGAITHAWLTTGPWVVPWLKKSRVQFVCYAGYTGLPGCEGCLLEHGCWSDVIMIGFRTGCKS